MLSSRLLSAVALVLVTASVALPAGAQMGGGRGGRRPPSGPDSADARRTRDPATINTVDVILERRGELALTADQVGRVSAAKTRRDVAVDTLRQRAEALRLPTDPSIWASMGDSERVAMRERQRARATVLRAQRDAEAQARADALAALDPDQRTRAQKMEDDMRSAAFAEQRLGGAARGDAPGTPRSGGGMMGGRMGGP